MNPKETTDKSTKIHVLHMVDGYTHIPLLASNIVDLHYLDQPTDFYFDSFKCRLCKCSMPDEGI